MVLFLLYMKAELENVESVTLRRDANLCINVRNPLSDGDEVREKVVFNPSMPIELKEGSGSREKIAHHFSLKWEGVKKPSILTVLTDAETKTALKKKKGGANKKVVVPNGMSYTADNAGNWVAILAVETRGLEPFAFFPMGGNDFFVLSSGGGKEFTEDIDFGEGDWADYDEENDLPVSMSDIEFKWESV